MEAIEMLQNKFAVVKYLKRGRNFDIYKTCCQILKNDMGMEEMTVDLSCPEEVLCKDADSLAKIVSTIITTPMILVGGVAAKQQELLETISAKVNEEKLKEELKNTNWDEFFFHQN